MNNPAKVYTWQLNVRSYELDKAGQVKPSVFQNYIEEGATQGSAANGYDYYWYKAQKTSWVARKISLRYHQPAHYGDQLEMQTWVSDFRRVQSHREYVLRRLRDNALILRARTNWVYIDTEHIRPIRFDDVQAFAPTGELEPIDTALANPQSVPSRIFSQQRAAQHHELDGAGHVNNSVYTGWSESVIEPAMSAARAANPILPQPRLLGREISFLASALEGDAIVVQSKLEAVDGNCFAWRSEIARVDGDKHTICVVDCPVYELPTTVPSEWLAAFAP
jgi:YbgC/YbaW family acyl-CoA thioester hydrolase